MFKCDSEWILQSCCHIDTGIMRCIHLHSPHHQHYNSATFKVCNTVHKICKSFFPVVFMGAQHRTGVYFFMCRCVERHEMSIVAAKHKRELGRADFPHGWEHSARGNSFIVPHKMAKIGPILGWRTFGWKSGEMLSCNNKCPKPLCNPFTNCEFEMICYL